MVQLATSFSAYFKGPAERCPGDSIEKKTAGEVLNKRLLLFFYFIVVRIQLKQTKMRQIHST